MRQDIGETLEVSYLVLWRRAITLGNQEAWTAFQQSLEENALALFHDHPGSEAASGVQSEKHFVALAFERLRHAVIQRQVVCETLPMVLLYLRASLNGAILETLRVLKRPGAILSPWSNVEAISGGSKVWDTLQARLPNQQEQRLAYLLYHCGLEPAEIVRCCPQEWSDVHEVVRLRRSILERLTK